MPAPDVFAALYVGRYPQDAARVLQRQPATEAAKFLETLSNEQRSALLQSMAPSEAAACLVALSPERQDEVVDDMPLVSLAPVVRRIAESDRGRFMERLAPAKRRRLNRALRYSENTAGGMADLDVPTIRTDQTISEAQKRSQRRGADLPYVYVTDQGHHLAGVMSRRELARAGPDKQAGAFMHRDVQSIPAYLPMEEVALLPGWRDLDAMPVMDATGVLVGVLRHLTVRRYQAEKTAETTASITVTRPAIELGTAYCDMLARALVSLTDTRSATRPSSSQ